MLLLLFVFPHSYSCWRRRLPPLLHMGAATLWRRWRTPSCCHGPCRRTRDGLRPQHAAAAPMLAPSRGLPAASAACCLGPGATAAGRKVFLGAPATWLLLLPRNKTFMGCLKCVQLGACWWWSL